MPVLLTMTVCLDLGVAWYDPIRAVAANIGSSFTLIWDVSNQTIAGGDYTGVLNLAILTTCLSVVPLGERLTDLLSPHVHHVIITLVPIVLPIHACHPLVCWLLSDSKNSIPNSNYNFDANLILGFVWLLPDSKDELRKLANEGTTSIHI